MRGAACAAAPAELGLGIDGIGSAGEVFINDDLLWRDASLAEPLSRSWNVPRWWLLPTSSLRVGSNTVWVRVVGVAALSSGLVGTLRLGDAKEVAEAQAQAEWRQRTVYFINAVLAGMAAALFLLVWGLRRQERAYGWFALMSLCWLAYLSTYLADTPWPFADSLDRARQHGGAGGLRAVCLPVHFPLWRAAPAMGRACAVAAGRLGRGGGVVGTAGR